MASSSQRSRSSGGGDATTMACFPALLDDDLHQHGVLQEEAELRRGPWTVDEDITLVNYIADHGEGRWNSLARAAGLKRTGKSCRLRWLNYLRPDVKRGNFTADEQLLILDLHSRWGNRARLRRYKSSVFLEEDACMGCTKAARLLFLEWSKIAQHLPGRTDNEIKNYWRTRVQKHAKQLNCDASSSKLRDAMRHLWMPRLVDQRFQQAAGVHAPSGSASMDNSSMVTSSSDSFASEPYDVDLYADVLAGEMLHVGDWMQEPNQGLLSEATQDNSSRLQDPELTGWVQSFSEGLPEDFWSLEDVWKMQ